MEGNNPRELSQEPQEALEETFRVSLGKVQRSLSYLRGWAAGGQQGSQ